MVTTALMGKQKNNKNAGAGKATAGDKGKAAGKRKGDRHKPGRQMRIHPALAEQLDTLAERNATTAPQEANRAIRELLEREGLWPVGGARRADGE